MKLSYNIIIGNEIGLTAEESKATNVYKASATQTSGGVSTSDQSHVLNFIDLKGSLDMPYTGISNPNIIGGAPRVTKKSGVPNYVLWKNIPNLTYQSNSYGINYNRGAINIIMISLPGQPFEAWTGFPWYIGENGGLVRAGSSDGTKYTISNGTTPTYYQIASLCIVFDTDYFTYYLNGLYKGRVANNLAADGYGTINLHSNVLGNGDANCPDWMMIAAYFYLGNDLDNLLSNITEDLTSIGNLHGVGQNYSKPYASNITAVYNSTNQTWDMTYNLINTTGNEIITYEWWLRKTPISGSAGSFGDQQLLTTSKSFNKSLYNSIDRRKALIPYVKVGDGEMLRGSAVENL